MPLKVLGTLVLLAVVIDLSTALICRKCERAQTIDDCANNVKCDNATEECFMEESVTDSLTIEYNAGCRSKEVCKTASQSSVGAGGGLGRRRRELIACSRCCSTDKCNEKMCGIKSLNANSSQCYACNSDIDGGQPDVHDPNDCNSFTVCPPDEMCFASTISSGTSVSHRYGCYNKKVCTFLTQQTINDFKRCADQTDPEHCGHNKRANAVCHVCCGDASCNSGSCGDVRRELYRLYKAKVLDYDTLKRNGTAPSAGGVTVAVGPTAGK